MDNKYKYLGIVLDSRLCFSKLVDYIRTKVINRIRMVSKRRPIVSEERSITLYKILVTPLFDYQDVAYGCLSPADIYTLQNKQNGALRTI